MRDPLPITWAPDPLLDFGLAEPMGEHLTRPDLPDGAAEWLPVDLGQPILLAYVCPCGCKHIHQLRAKGPGEDERAGGWDWCGDRATPSFDTAIFHNPSFDPLNCGWLGRLDAGVWTTVRDGHGPTA